MPCALVEAAFHTQAVHNVPVISLSFSEDYFQREHEDTADLKPVNTFWMNAGAAKFISLNC